MMMRKTSAMFGVAALLLALLLGQTGSGQMPGPMGPMGPSQPQAQQPMSPQMLEQEIELLIAINRMGLSPEQLRQLQQVLSELRASQQAHMQSQQELRDFLLRWQGTPEAFEQSLQNLQQQVQQPRTRRQELMAQLKDVLTYRQGEQLREALQKLSDGTAPMPSQMGQPMGRMGMGMMSGPMGQGQMGMMGPMGPAQGQGPGMPMMNMMQRMQQMGGMGQAPSFDELVLKHLELLERVISEKLQALQGQQP